MTRRRRPATSPRLESLDERLLMTVLTPAAVDSAYGLNAVSFSKGAVQGNGAGQTIAIIDAYHDPAIYGDLAAFDARNGLPNPVLSATLPAVGASVPAKPVFTMVNFAGTSTDSTWNEEEAIDVEMAHAAAPAANIVLVEANGAGLSGFLTAITAVKTLPSVSVISMSWGGPEFQGQQQFDSTFTTPSGHIGITYLASSGDSGAGAQWPSSSPNVVSVGGTSLAVSVTGARASESAWAGSGGGPSQVETKPTYQGQVVSGQARSTPDVSIVADPNTGVVINTWGQKVQVGGTSLAAPIWAGLFAVADQGLALAGKSTLDGATQSLPDLYKAPAGSFHDITTGSRATLGYDASTGLGSPNAVALIGFLDGVSRVTTVNGVGASTSIPAPSVSVPLPPSASPALVGSWASSPAGGSTTSPTAPMPDLVAIPLPPASMEPSAIDAILDGWGRPGSSATGAKGKARG